MSAESPAQLIARSKAAVVRICLAATSATGGATLRVLGSGFVVGKGGTVATALHVIDVPQGTAIVVLPYDRDQADLRLDEADVIGRDPEHDLALLHVPSLSTVQPMQIDPWPDPQMGEQAIVLGFPLGDPSLTAVGAMVAATVQRKLEGAIQDTRLFKLDSAIITVRLEVEQNQLVSGS